MVIIAGYKEELDDSVLKTKGALNINADLTVPVCCLVFNRKSLVAPNYLNTPLSEINLNKSNSEICTKCMELRLPEYNMGFNKKGWNDYALEKSSTDIS